MEKRFFACKLRLWRCRGTAFHRTDRSASGPSSTPLRSTSMTPRLPTSEERRVRNFTRWKSFGIVCHAQLVERLRLGGAQKGEELWHIDGDRAVIVLGTAGKVAGTRCVGCVLDGVRGDANSIRAGHVPDDECLQTLLARVRRAHCVLADPFILPRSISGPLIAVAPTSVLWQFSVVFPRQTPG